MDESLIDLLACPACQGGLRWRIRTREGEQILTADAVCAACGTSFPIREGIAVFLASESPQNDLWKTAESGLTRYLRANPEIEQRLLSTPLEELGPADGFYRAWTLEAKGDFAAAEEAERYSTRHLYTPDYVECWQRQVDFLIDRLHSTKGPIVDLASGRCALVNAMLQRLDHAIVATDFSLTVMRRNKDWLEAKGHTSRVSLIVLDARKMPFHSRTVPTLTTNLGLANIRAPGQAVREIRRILKGHFFAISHFYPPGDGNELAIAESGLAETLYEEQTLHIMTKSGLRVNLHNQCESLALPTPVGEIIEGAIIDRLPQVQTRLRWSVLEAA